MKIKNKTRFRVLCALYVIGYLFFCILGGMNSGMMISDSPALAFAAIYYGLPVGVRNLSVSMFVWIILSFFLVLAILWQTNLSKQKLNRNSIIEVSTAKISVTVISNTQIKTFFSLLSSNFSMAPEKDFFSSFAISGMLNNCSFSLLFLLSLISTPFVS